MNRYAIQVNRVNSWVTVAVGAKGYCEGYYDCLTSSAPRPELRLIGTLSDRAWFDRSDIPEDDIKKIISYSPERENVEIGLVAGWPSAEQYERAAEMALSNAKRIRESMALTESRRSKQ